MTDRHSLTLDDFQEFARQTDVDPDSTDPLIPLLGLGVSAPREN